MILTRFAVASLWLVLVLFLGSADFSAQETGRFVLPALKFLIPGTPPAQLQALHLILRKLAHIAEYAVLALLWFKAVRQVGGRTLRTAAWVALLDLPGVRVRRRGAPVDAPVTPGKRA
jgi:VanZ family protein